MWAPSLPAAFNFLPCQSSLMVCLPLYDGSFCCRIGASKSVALVLGGCNAKCHSGRMPMQLEEQMQYELPWQSLKELLRLHTQCPSIQQTQPSRSTAHVSQSCHVGELDLRQEACRRLSVDPMNPLTQPIDVLQFVLKRLLKPNYRKTLEKIVSSMVLPTVPPPNRGNERRWRAHTHTHMNKASPMGKGPPFQTRN